MQRITASCSAILISAALVAQAQTPSPGSAGFEKKNYNYSEWTKGLFSEVVTVTHPGKMIFLAGVGKPRTRVERVVQSGTSATSRASAAMPMIRSSGY